MDWDREKIKEVLQMLSKLPDFDNLLFPESWGTEYNIPITSAKIVDLKEYIKKNKEARELSLYDSFEVRQPAPGGVREIKVEEEPLTLTIETVPYKPEELPEGLAFPTIENGKEQQQNQELCPTGAAPSFDDAGCNGLSAPCPSSE